MNEFYTYAYLREDGTPYYIGKGKAYRIYNKHRKYKPPKDKSRIIFLKKNLTEEEAFKHEKYMIAIFGRKDNGTGILRNKTEGGEGCSGVLVSEERRRKAKDRMSGPKNISAKNILIINISGDNHIVCGEFKTFCKSKNIPYEGIVRRIRRESKTPTKCGWYAFDITHKGKSEIEDLKNKFILKYRNRFNSNLIDIEIPSGIEIAKKSISIVFNLIKEKNENNSNIVYYNNKKYVKITEEEFKKNGVSAKTARRAIKVLKMYEIVNVEKLNRSNLDNSNYYTIIVKD
jgi:hypothetical protein